MLAFSFEFKLLEYVIFLLVFEAVPGVLPCVFVHFLVLCLVH